MSTYAWRPAAVALSLLSAATFAGAGCTFLAQALLARRMGPAQFGLFASSLATVTMVAPLAGFGLSQFRLRAYGAEGWRAQRWLRPSLRFSAITGAVAIGIVIAWALAGPAVDAETRSTLLLLSPVILGVFAIDLLGGKLRLEERHGALAAWQLAMPAGRLCIALLALAASDANATWVAFGYGAVALAATAMATPQLRAMQRGDLALHGHGTRIPNPDEASPGVGALWSQAWAYGLNAVLYPVFFQIGTVLLKYLGDNEQAGRFGVALAVMTAIYLLPATIYQKFLIAKLHRWAVHEPDKFWHAHRLGNAAMSVAGLAVGLLVALLAHWAVPLGFGERYRGAATVLMVLSVCVPIRFLSTAVGSALLTSDQMRYRALAMGAAALAAIAFNLLLIGSHGEIGAAMATVAAEIVLLAAMFHRVRLMRRRGA